MYYHHNRFCYCCKNHIMILFVNIIIENDLQQNIILKSKYYFGIQSTLLGECSYKVIIPILLIIIDTNIIQQNSYLLLAKVCSNTNNLIIDKRFFQKITSRIRLCQPILLFLYPYLLKNYKFLVSLAQLIFLFLLSFQSNLNL